MATTPICITRDFKGSTVKSTSFPEVSVDGLWTGGVHCIYTEGNLFYSCFFFQLSSLAFTSFQNTPLWFVFKGVHKTLPYFVGVC